jgi:hypothetical protein
MKVKKAAKILLCACLLAAALTVFAHADMGPKASVTVEFRGFEGRKYYATLLSRESSQRGFVFRGAGHGANAAPAVLSAMK